MICSSFEQPILPAAFFTASDAFETAMEFDVIFIIFISFCPSPTVMKPAARENVEIFFFSHILNGLQKELGGTLQNFAVSRLAKITCSIFAVSIDER